MKKKKLIIIIAIAVVVLALLLIPHKYLYKDGGTVEYSAVLYSITNYHALTDGEDENGNIQYGYTVGKVVKILGFVVSDDTHFEMDPVKTAENTKNPLPAQTTPTPTEGPTQTPTDTPTPIPTTEPVTVTPPATPDIENYYVFDSGRKLTVDDLSKVDGAKALEPFYDAVFADMLGLSVEDAKACLMCNNTPSAYKNLTYGNVDMIFCALPSEEQVAEAEANGVEFEYHTILSGGFVFFVNKDNPVDSITQEQLKGIVSGKITNWKEVGGEDEPIKLYQRNEGSGSQTGLYRYVLPKEEVMPPIIEQYEDSMEGVVDRVSDYDNGRGAISYSYYYYVANMYTSDEIKLLGIDGVIPSDETISQGTYPFLNFSQIVTRKDLPEYSIVRDIIDYVQGENGARIARENGYVPYLPAGESGNSTSNIVLGSNEALSKNAELHSQLLPFSEYSTIGTGAVPGTEKFNEKRVKANEYGISVYDPKYVTFIKKSADLEIIQVNGLKDKAIEKKINDRINEVVDILLDPAYLPDVSGIIPFIKEHGRPKADIYMSSGYNENHIMSVAVNITYTWEERIRADWFTDIPDPDGDGKLESSEILEYLREQEQKDPYSYMNVSYVGFMRNYTLQQWCEYSKTWCVYDEIPLNFNLETGEEIRLSDMFLEGTDYLGIITKEMYDRSVKYHYWFDDYNYQNGEPGYGYEPEREYDGGTIFTGIDPDIKFGIQYDHQIAVWDDKGHYTYIETSIPVYNMVNFEDIFEEEDESIPEYLEWIDLSDWYDIYFNPELFYKQSSFEVSTVDAETVSVDVYFLTAKKEKSFAGVAKNDLPGLAKDMFDRSGIFLYSTDKCGMYPDRIYVYPNGYVCIMWKVIIVGDSEEYLNGRVNISLIQWVKDGKDILPADMIDNSPEELLKILFMKSGGWSISDKESRLPEEDAEKAAKILAPHLVSFVADGYLVPRFDFQLSDMYDSWKTGGGYIEGLTTDEKAALPGEVLLRVIDRGNWSYFDWNIKSLNGYYKHFKMYEGYEF
ncbi:MAG: substrate-binding domain-containing protein [Lachnospiraceae bacterium]|nr:substrate-binding domain-containing protein [Lachnospiraceae bacterium]